MNSVAMTIQSQAYPYHVETHDSLAAVIRELAADPKACFLVDRNILKLYPAEFAGVSPVISIQASEETKSYEALPPIFTQFLSSGFKRDGHLVVVGGGVTQDIGAFIAANLFRGVRWSLVPTTLLAQADSCIGGKSSINIGGYKNMLGNFYAPRRVLLVFDVLATLKPDDIRSGLGEILKLFYINGQALPNDFERTAANPAYLGQLALKALTIKKRFIEEDEFDRGVRNLLNYGHTFGHAYESATHYGIPHGIGVTLGMLSAAFFSERLGLVAPGEYGRLKKQWAPYFTPFDALLKKLGTEPLIAAMKLDKKNSGSRIHFILTRGPGQLEKRALDAESEATPLLKEFLEQL